MKHWAWGNAASLSVTIQDESRNNAILDSLRIIQTAKSRPTEVIFPKRHEQRCAEVAA